MSVFLFNFYRFLHNYCILFSVKLQLILQFLCSDIWGAGDFVGSYYIGNFKDGVLHGNGEFHWNDGVVYKGKYENGKMNGHGTMTFPEGTKWEGKWKDDKFVD